MSETTVLPTTDNFPTFSSEKIPPRPASVNTSIASPTTSHFSRRSWSLDSRRSVDVEEPGTDVAVTDIDSSFEPSTVDDESSRGRLTLRTASSSSRSSSSSGGEWQHVPLKGIHDTAFAPITAVANVEPIISISGSRYSSLAADVDETSDTSESPSTSSSVPQAYYSSAASSSHDQDQSSSADSFFAPANIRAREPCSKSSNSAIAVDLHLEGLSDSFFAPKNVRAREQKNPHEAADPPVQGLNDSFFAPSNVHHQARIMKPTEQADQRPQGSADSFYAPASVRARAHDRGPNPYEPINGADLPLQGSSASAFAPRALQSTSGSSPSSSNGNDKKGKKKRCHARQKDPAPELQMALESATPEAMRDIASKIATTKWNNLPPSRPINGKPPRGPRR